MSSTNPSPGRQRSFIVDNASILDLETMRTILSIVMQEVGKEAHTKDGKVVHIILESAVTKDVSIDLDAIESPEVIQQIYNIVKNRRTLLNEPARVGNKR